MKILKKMFLMLLVVTFIIAMVSINGCKSGTAAETTAAAAETTAAAAETTAAAADATITDKPITINFWTLAGPMTTYITKWKGLYEKEHPNVTINIVANEQNAIMDVMASALSSGSEKLDITFYWPGAGIDTWAREGLLLDLAPYYEQNGWWDKKNPGAQTYKTDGTGMYTFTTDWVTVPQYFYNKAIFDAAGVEPPKTIDDLFTISEKIKAANYEVWGAGVVTRYPITAIFNDYLARVMSTEDFTKLVNWERDANKSVESAKIYLNPAVAQSWELIKKMVDAGIFVKGANAMDDTAARQTFTSGKTAIYLSGSWAMTGLNSEAPDLDYDFFNLPAVDGRQSICSGYNGLSIPAYVAEDEEKMAVIIDFLNSTFGKEYSKAMFAEGTIADNTTLSDADLSELVSDPMLIRIIQDVKQFGDVGIIDALMSPALRQNYYNVAANLFEGKITPEEAAQGLYDGAVELLQQ